MSMTTMLVHITADDGSAQRLETAITLARDHAARLIGLFVTQRMDIPAYAQTYVGNEVIQARRHAAKEEADKAEAAFRDRVTEDDIAAEWRAEIGDALHLVPLPGQRRGPVGRRHHRPIGQRLPARHAQLPHHS